MNNQLETTNNQTTSILFIFSSSLLSVTLVSALILTGSYGSAETKNASVTVSSACTMTTTGTGSYSATINNNTYAEIVGSPLNVECNDASGYSIYAIGYSGDSYTDNNTKMIASTGVENNIPTATSGNNSWWAMKVAGSGTDTPTIDNSFSSYQQIPATYTKISHATNDTTNSVTTPTYKVNISGTQAAGTYTGKVKYTVVHPNNAPAPVTPPTPPTSCNTPVPGATYMQDVNSSIISGLTKGAAYYLRDNRDEKPYCVSKLEDDKLWMLDNLALDLVNSTVLNGMNENNTNASNATLGYLKNGGGTTSDQWPTSGVSYWTSSYSYSDPKIAIKNADDESWNPDTTTTSYGNGSGKIGIYYNYCAASAGTYCWGNGTSDSGSPSSDPKTSSPYDIDGDICPKGWHLPTTTSGGEYQNLYNAYSGASGGQKAAFKSALSTPLSGYFRYGSAVDQGSVGDFWSSTWYGTSGMRSLNVSSSNVFPSENDSRYYGDSVRCVQGSA